MQNNMIYIGIYFVHGKGTVKLLSHLPSSLTPLRSVFELYARCVSHVSPTRSRWGL